MYVCMYVCLCGASFVSYWPKCSAQIYKAQYRDAIFVLLRGAQIWWLYITEHLELNYPMIATTLRS